MRVTMDDVAREAGVSRALVSLALRDAYGVSKTTRDHIRGVARRLSYQPNALASGLARRTNTTVGVFLLDLHNEFFADVFDGVRDAVGGGGTELVLSVGSIHGSLDKPALDALVRAQVRLVIAVGLLLSDDDLAEYQKSLHLVSVARRVVGSDNVLTRNELGARLAVEHLVELGHRRIMHLAAPVSDGYTGRRRGYRRAMNAAGLKPWVVSADYSRPAAARVMSEVVDAGELPAAVFAHNDQTALGVLDALHARGVRVPEDVSVIGYDNTSASSPPGVGLTTVDVHAAVLGRRAAEVALARMAEPGSPLVTESISPTLVIRTTTAPPRTC
jgi:DNA-binding LacI/PurR family transcriptional regulator